ncbi:MAG: solute:Na+ symporter, family [Thermoanaerobacteraceae bacterium]|nr:solute:Na+ symporter, family [Thermoanaerobacteraceae bacterium]
MLKNEEVLKVLSGKLYVSGLIIMVIYIVGMLIIGIYCNKKYANTLSNFLTGGRSLGPWLFALVYGSTYFSSSTMVGNAGTGYKAGVAWLFMPATQFICLPLGILIFSYGLRKMSVILNVMTVPDFISERYKSPLSGALGSILIIVFMIPYMVAVVKGGAVSLQTLLNVSYSVAALLVCGVAGAYMVAGGYMARAYTDFVQGILMFIGALVTFVLGFKVLGGPAGIAAKLASIDFNLVETPGPLGWSGIFLFSTVFGIAPWGLPQLVQTNFTIKKREVVYTSAIFLSIWAAIVLFCANGSGVMARAYFGDKLIKNPDLAFPMFVLSMMPNIMGTIVICSIIAAAMSTIDGVLMTAGTAFSCDIYKKFINKNASESAVLKLTSAIMLIITVIVYFLALNPPQMLLYLTSYAFSVIAAAFIAPIFFGIYWKKGTSAGCLASMISGTVFTLIWYALQNNGKFPLGLPPFLSGMIVSFLVFFIVSKYTLQLPADFIEKLFSEDIDLEIYEDVH